MPIIRRQTPTSSTDTLATTVQDRTVVAATGSAAAIAAISATYPATANNGNTLIIAATDRDYVVSSNGTIWTIETDPITDGQRRYVVNNESVTTRTFASWSTEDNRWHSDAFTANEVPDSQEDKLAALLPEIPDGYDPALVGGYLTGAQVFHGGTLYTANKASLDPPGPFAAADWDTFVTEDDGKEITQQLDGATLGYASIGYLQNGGTYPLTTNINTAKKVDAIIPPNSAVTVDGTLYTNASLTESQGLKLYNDGTGWVRESAGAEVPSSSLSFQGLTSFFQWTGNVTLGTSGTESPISMGNGTAVDLSLATHALFIYKAFLSANNPYLFSDLQDLTADPSTPYLSLVYNNGHIDVEYDRAQTDLSVGDIIFRRGGSYQVVLVKAEFFTLVETGLTAPTTHVVSLDQAGSVKTFLNGQTFVNLMDMKFAEVAVTLDPGFRLALANPNPAPGVTIRDYDLGIISIVTASDKTIRLEQESI